MKKEMKIETSIGLLCNSLGLIISRFNPLQSHIFDFLSGALLSLGILLFVISLLPENVYQNLLYRKLLANRK